jgi:hypothetical protein
MGKYKKGVVACFKGPLEHMPEETDKNHFSCSTVDVKTSREARLGVTSN